MPEAKINQLDDPRLGEQHVLKFDIAVRHTQRVHVQQARSRLHEIVAHGGLTDPPRGSAGIDQHVEDFLGASFQDHVELAIMFEREDLESDHVGVGRLGGDACRDGLLHSMSLKMVSAVLHHLHGHHHVFLGGVELARVDRLEATSLEWRAGVVSGPRGHECDAESSKHVRTGSGQRLIHR